MKLKSLALSLALASVTAHPQIAPSTRPIPMLFTGTDVALALKAIGLRTRTGIVYAAGKEKATVSLNATVSTADEAIRAIVSAAGLAYRKVGLIYVVAAPSELRRALEPYAKEAEIPVASGRAIELVPRLQAALPYAFVDALGEDVSVVGVPEDIQRAREIIDKLDRSNAETRTTTDVVILRQTQASVIAPLVSGLYSTLKVTPSTNDKGVSAVALAGPQNLVRDARATVERLDGSMGDATVFKVYNLRYSTGPAIADFLKQAAPTVETFAGPEAYIPKRAIFNPVSATLSSGDSGQGFFGGSNSTSGTGTNGNLGGATSGTGNQTNEPPYRVGDRAKIVVLKGPASDVEAALKLVAEIDRKPRQVVVEVNVIETSPSNDSNVGLQYNWAPFDFIETPPGSIVDPNPGGTAFTKAPTRPVGVGQFSRVPWNFRATLNAMVTNKEAKILAKPSVSVVDNGQASVFIGDTLRARVTGVGALGAQNVTIQSFPVGIILLIAPRVNADGNITLHVNPVVSSVTAIDADGIPTTSAREAETTTIVKSGETVAIGGLIRDEDIRTIQSVPLLSRLPIVGELFKNRLKSHKRNDIIVTITPHLVEEEKEAAKP